MFRFGFLTLAFAAAVMAGCAKTDGAPSQAAAGIPFVQFGNIYTWEADGEKGIYVESEDRKWYYASFMFPCRNLPFDMDRIGFRGTPPLPLDKFDSIIVRGEPCYFKTFDRVAGPPGSKAAQAAPPPS